MADVVSDLEGALLLYTKKIVATPLAFSIPGWVSVAKALDFLKEYSKGEGRLPLREFLYSAGVR